MSALDPHDLTAPYAVDAVTGAERRAAEEHLAGCEACRSELAELFELLGEVGAAAPVEPPPSLRAAVMARLDDVTQLPRAVPAAQQAGAQQVGARRRRTADGDELAARRRGRRRVLPLLAAAASAVVLAGAAVLGVTAVHDRSDRDAAQRAAVALARVAAAPDAVTVAATTTDRAWSQTRLVVSRLRQQAVLIPAGTRPAPSGRTWEVWFLDGGTTPRPAGTFDTGTAGAEVLSGGVGPASVVAVTLEPDGGSTAPTTTPVATYPVPAACAGSGAGPGDPSAPARLPATS